MRLSKKVYKEKAVRELVCGEAINIPTDIKYDAIVSNSVFSYFPDNDYAKNVLDKIMKKTNYSIGLIDIHDITQKDAFTEYRRKTVEDYDEKYKDLRKHFYDWEFFSDWARDNNLSIEFCDSTVEGYWNNEFIFNVFFYK